MSILWQIILIKSFIDVSYQRRPLAGTKCYVSQWWFLTAILLTLSNFYFNFSTPFLFWLLFYSFSHILNGRHKCHFCGSSHATKRAMQNHICFDSFSIYISYSIIFYSSALREIPAGVDANSKPGIGCYICGKAYLNLKSLYRHRKTHNLSGRHKCRFCDKSYQTNRSLISHISAKHRQEQKSM